MVINVQKYISSTYNISIDVLKGKKTARCEQDYNLYNLIYYIVLDFTPYTSVWE